MTLAPLRAMDTQWLRDIIAADPAGYAYIARLFEHTGSAEIDTPAGRLWGWFIHGRPVSAYYIGGTIMPVAATTGGNAAVARMLNARGRYMCSFVGPANAVLDLHHRLTWGVPRVLRSKQPLLIADRQPDTAPDRRVRLGRPEETDIVFDAAVHMFTEEVGFSPIEMGKSGYLHRVRGLLSAGETFLITSGHGPDGGPIRRYPAPESAEQVVFKADVGIRSEQVAQIQGVWVHPDFRGRGLAAPAVLAATEQVKATMSPLVSLYVNAFNEPALRTYRRAGYRQIGTYATVIY